MTDKKQEALFADTMVSALDSKHFGKYGPDSFDRDFREAMVEIVLLYISREKMTRMGAGSSELIKKFSQANDNILDWTHINRDHFLELLDKDLAVKKMMYESAYNFGRG